jgi:hypothetical protein
MVLRWQSAYIKRPTFYNFCSYIYCLIFSDLDYNFCCMEVPITIYEITFKANFLRFLLTECLTFCDVGHIFYGIEVAITMYYKAESSCLGTPGIDLLLIATRKWPSLIDHWEWPLPTTERTEPLVTPWNLWLPIAEHRIPCKWPPEWGHSPSFPWMKAQPLIKLTLETPWPQYTGQVLSDPLEPMRPQCRAQNPL